MTFIRNLSNIEYAFAYSNTVYPLSVVICLHLSNGPQQAQLRKALDGLQSRHLLLNAGIRTTGNRWHFYQLSPVPPIPIELKERQTEGSWKTGAEQALNTTFDMDGPLMRCIFYPYGEGGKAGELLVVFHHAIMDGSACRLVLHELLHLCGGGQLSKLDNNNQSQSIIRHSYPEKFRGWRLAIRLVSFMMRQIPDEIKYMLKGQSHAVPTSAHNAIINLQLSETESRKLIHKTGISGLSLNSVLGAAILLATYSNRFPKGKKTWLRAIAFADMRLHQNPIAHEFSLGCFISMLRFSLAVQPDQNLKEAAKLIYLKMYNAGRTGDPFLYAFMAKYLVRMSLKMGKFRLSTTALSYLGKLDLQRQYGEIELKDVHAYITNNPLGPEFSAFGKILFGKIEMDFTYLPAEIDTLTAERIVMKIKELLEDFYNES